MTRYLRFFTIGIALLAFLSVGVYYLCPRPELKSFTPYSKAYFDSQGQLLRLSLASDDRYRLYDNLENIAPAVVSATILYEDQNFYKHFGVDLRSLLRAFWITYITKQRRVGASTIVMQVARLRWSIPSKTLSGKIYQIARALQISRHYSKHQIMEAYLNLAPYGRNIEGIAAASLIYFNKKPSELNLPEALMLAVIPQNPNKRNPTTARGYRTLLSARQRLFKRWVIFHPSDAPQLKYMDLPLNIRSPEQLPFYAPHFVDYLSQKLSTWDSGYIETTLDLGLQQSITSLIQQYVDSKRSVGIQNASALLVNYKTLAIEAMVGSADFFDTTIQGQVNGTLAKRSPGSTLKPFVYALAMDEGLIHPMSLLRDAPKKFGGFTPENYDHRFMGPISVKDALIQSRNVPAVQLQSQLKSTSFYQFLKRAGIQHLREESFYGLALALGGGELTSLELAALYGMLGNGGNLKNLRTLAHEPQSAGTRLLSPEASFLTLDILKDNPGVNTLDIDIPGAQDNKIAWKTGTSWAYRDAWAAGISGPYVLIVWVGNFDGGGNSAFVGRRAAGPLFFRIWDAVLPVEQRTISSNPSTDLNLKRVSLCANTGDLYEKHCPASIESWFIPGVSPIKLSNIYRTIPINNDSDMRACWYEQGKTQWKVYEFWPSDFLSVFQKAGISLKSPPHYEADCDLDQTSTTGLTPVIRSPQSSIDYVARPNNADINWIPLEAVVDPDVSKLHWFIEDEYIGTASNGQTLLWSAKPGYYLARVVDDAGRTTSKRFSVVSSY
jgi:penicillin-binding protein 1C